MLNIDDLVFLDFEGFKNQKPIIVGIKTNGLFTQFCFNPLFANEKIPKENILMEKDFEEFLPSLYKTSKVIVCFTNHEIHEFKKCLGVIDEEKFLDVHKIFKKYIKSNRNRYEKYKTLPEWKKKKNNNRRWALKTMLKFSEFDIQEPYGKGKVTKWMQSVLDGVKSSGGLTATQKRNLTLLLRHNQTDVLGMEHLMKVAKQF